MGPDRVGMLGMCLEASKSGSALNHSAGTSFTQTAFSKISGFKSQGYSLYVISGVALNVYSKAQIKFYLLRAKAKSKSKPLQKFQTNYFFASICFVFANSIGRCSKNASLILQENQ